MSQRELARAAALPPSRITQILEQGSMPRDIDGFADALKLTGEARRAFLRQVVYGPNLEETAEEDTDQVNISRKHLIDFAEEQYDTVYQVRIRGDSAFAIQKAQKSLEMLKSCLRHYTDTSLFQPLVRIQGLILLEQVIAYSEIHSQKENFKNTKKAIGEIHRIAKLCGDQELWGMAQFLLGNNYYLIGNHARSLPLIQDATQYLHDVDNLLWAQRGLVLDWAYLKQPTQFEQTEQMIRQIINEGKFSKLERVCESYEAIGRGWGELHSDRAFAVFDEGWKIYDLLEQQATGTSTRFAQLVRGTLSAAKHLGRKDSNLEKLAQQGIDYATKYSYTKYAQQIARLRQEIYDG
jgi:tetratricopeptide (TPR) repeat protein